MIKYALVVWIDAATVDDWHDASDDGPVLVYSCGLLVKDEPEYITLSSCQAQDDMAVNGSISIPRSYITKMETRQWKGFKNEKTLC